MNLKKQLTIICTILILAMVFVDSSKLVSASEFEGENKIQVITPPTKEEIEGNNKKLIEAEDYINNKEVSRSYNSKSVLSNYKTAVQPKGYYCGPTAAYNGTNGAYGIEHFATCLHTTDNTEFPGWWVGSMNSATKYNNNYQILRGRNYSISEWRYNLKNAIIVTTDKGYPTIADCNITSNSNTWLHYTYSYATDTKHYVAVVGYDDLPQRSAMAYIVDSNSRKGIPLEYWCYLDNLTNATKPFGVVW